VRMVAVLVVVGWVEAVAAVGRIVCPQLLHRTCCKSGLRFLQHERVIYNGKALGFHRGADTKDVFSPSRDRICYMLTLVSLCDPRAVWSLWDV